MNIIKEIIFVLKHWSEIITPIDRLSGKGSVFKIGEFLPFENKNNP
jgi:hypothetical protein